MNKEDKQSLVVVITAMLMLFVFWLLRWIFIGVIGDITISIFALDITLNVMHYFFINCLITIFKLIFSR